MHRTEGQYHSSNMFADGPPGTRVEQNWLNAIQEEIANVIEQSGVSLLTGATDTRDQLYAAILNTVRVPRGFIDGLILSNAADADNDITMAIGKARDSGDNYTINSTIPLTKQIDIAWAAGSSQGGFPTGLGAAGNNTWYHFFAIMKTDGTVDAGYDTSLVAANLLADAAGYTLYRRVGSVLTDGAAHIYPFIQIGDFFIWDTPLIDITDAATGVAEKTAAIRVPLGVECRSFFGCWYTGSNAFMYFRHPDSADIAPAAGVAPLPFYQIAGENINGQTVFTNASSQIKYRSSANVSMKFSTNFYQDFRGRNL